MAKALSQKSGSKKKSLELLASALGERTETIEKVRDLLRGLVPHRTAQLLETLPQASRLVAWEVLPLHRQTEVLQFLRQDMRDQFLRNAKVEDRATLFANIPQRELAEVIRKMPQKLVPEVLDTLDEQEKDRIKRVLSFDEQQAGSLMRTDAVTVRKTLSMEVVVKFLRRHAALPESFEYLFVVDRTGLLLGMLPLPEVLRSTPDETVEQRMTPAADIFPILGDSLADEAAQLFQRHELKAAPIVDEQGIFVGYLSSDDVRNYARDNADQMMRRRGGISDDEADTFAPVLMAAPNRIIWLCINLATAIIASATIRVFEDTLAKVVALAILMPIVSSMGGIAGTQTLTVMIRGLALGNIAQHNTLWLINRELLLSALNGFALASLVAIGAAWWFDDPLLGLIISSALLINLMTAGLAGAYLPLMLKKMRIDPAVASGVILTTITDVVGFASFLGLATIAY